MKFIYASIIVGLIIGASLGIFYFSTREFTIAETATQQFSDAEVGFEDVEDEFPYSEDEITRPNLPTPPLPEFLESLGRHGRWAYWWKEFSTEEKRYYESLKRKDGPARVGIQIGHWKNSEVPDELEGLKRNGGGASGGGKYEVDVVLQIGQKVKSLLEARGVIVDLLPATVPEKYIADAFVSIHADGNVNSSVSGFKIASPQRDFSGRSVILMETLYETYAKETGLKTDKNITRRMSGYYAFNWRRYKHTVSPITPAVIVETGFLTNPTDRKIIVDNQDKSAKGIADGILKFLSANSLI